ncbi:MAG: hypothetical protein PHR30_10145 [Gallionellaceae bacterium]|nr:hypothetical protein [Gallionellaceae bacterium]MDD5365690.1 hypothetical protein [Gallionellaceae bacterium]
MKNRGKDHLGFVILLIGFGLFRIAVADWNPIPSGSMRPNLLTGGEARVIGQALR